MSLPSRSLARWVGYAVISGVLGVVVAVLGLSLGAKAKTTEVLVRFPELATLREGDAVVENGVSVGEVEAIALSEGRPVVTLRLHHHRTLAADTRFLNLSHSLMGARKVWLVPGTSPAALDPAELHEGEFVPGLPETLHKVDSLVSVVARLRATTDTLIVAGGAGAALLGPLEGALAGLDDLSARLDEGARALRTGLNTVDHAARRAAALTTSARAGEPSLDTAHARSRALLASAARAETTLAAALDALEGRLAALADTSRMGAGRLLNDRALYDSLTRGLNTLKDLTHMLKRGGLGDDIKIKPRFRGSGSSGNSREPTLPTP